MHDVLDPRDLVPDEAEQLASSGYPAQRLLEQARAAAAAQDLTALSQIESELVSLPRDAAWSYQEPSDAAALSRTLASTDSPAVDKERIADRLEGAWLGRCIANTMGKPVEGLQRAEVEIYLRATGQWPQTGYIPLLTQLPPGVSHLHESAPDSAAGCFDAVPRDDDLDWTILGLHLLETYGSDLTTQDIAREWLDRIPFSQTFTAERAAYRNLVSGLLPPQSAAVRNPYREWIGALIRVDAYGYVHPGAPNTAARLALNDAVLSHTANGIYGAMWAAALVAQALVSEHPLEALEAALAVVPQGSRLHSSQAAVLQKFRAGTPLPQVLAWIDTELGFYNWVHTLHNAATIAAALLWGEDDFLTTVGVAVSMGRDTDSSAATVGSVFGALHGTGSIPDRLVAPTHGTVRSAVRGFDRITIPELAQRTDAVRTALARKATA